MTPAASARVRLMRVIDGVIVLALGSQTVAAFATQVSCVGC